MARDKILTLTSSLATLLASLLLTSEPANARALECGETECTDGCWKQEVIEAWCKAQQCKSGTCLSESDDCEPDAGADDDLIVCTGFN